MAITTFPLNIDKVENFLESQPGESGPRWHRFNQGVSTVRILPPWNIRGDLALRVMHHRIQYRPSVHNYDRWEWTCKASTFNHLGGQQYTCPICDALDTMQAKGINISEWQATNSVYHCNAIIIKDPLYDKDPKSNKAAAPGTHVILRLPWTVYSFIMTMIKEVGDITNLETGRDIMVIRTGTGLNTTYQVTLGSNPPGPLLPAYLDNIKDLYDLDDIFANEISDQAYQELANSILNSSGDLNQLASTVQTQMSQPAYQAPAVNTQAQPVQTYANPVPQQAQPLQQVQPVQQSSPTVIPPAFGQGQGTAPTQVTVDQVVSAAQNSTRKPCFGNFNPSDPNCIVCNDEPDCAANTN